MSDLPPTVKRHSLLEQPDDGESWPEGFDATTVYSQVPRLLKVGELRRNLDNFFGIPLEREPRAMYGVLLHQENDEYNGVVLIDTNNALRHVAFIDVPVCGTAKYGYKATRPPEIFSNENTYTIDTHTLITYFTVPNDFAPSQGEILSGMVAAAREELRTTERTTRELLAAKTLSLIE